MKLATRRRYSGDKFFFKTVTSCHFCHQLFGVVVFLLRSEKSREEKSREEKSREEKGRVGERAKKSTLDNIKGASVALAYPLNSAVLNCADVFI